MRIIPLPVGKIVHGLLGAINPLESIYWWAQLDAVLDDAGAYTYTYVQNTLNARIQPVTHDLIFKEKLELGNNYKCFYILSDDIQTVNRNISTAGDYFYYNNLYWRVMRILEEFDTGWQRVIGMQTNEPPGDFIAALNYLDSTGFGVIQVTNGILAVKQKAY